MPSSPSSPPPPSWAILGAIPRVSADLPPPADLWAHHTYKAARLPRKIPVLTLIHPNDPAVVYSFLDDHIFAVDLRHRAVVACDLYHLVDPPKDLVSTRFVHAWHLPQALSPSSPDFHKEDTDDGESNDVAATPSVHM